MASSSFTAMVFQAGRSGLFGGSEGRHVRELSVLAAQKVFQGGGSGVLVAQTL